MIVDLIEAFYRLLWGDLFTLPVAGGIGISFMVVLLFAAGIGFTLRTRLLPVRLFENFYRNGSLVFGGGQVLAPLLYTEFVEFKGYLTSEEFLSGLGLVQALPGPNFSFAAYIGALAMRGEGSGLSGQLLGALVGGILIGLVEALADPLVAMIKIMLERQSERNEPALAAADQG